MQIIVAKTNLGADLFVLDLTPQRTVIAWTQVSQTRARKCVKMLFKLKPALQSSQTT